MNPDVAHVLFLCEYMEKVGRGSLKIIEECEKAGLRSPLWESSPTKGVTLTLFSSQDTMQDTMQDTKQDTMQDTMQDKHDVSDSIIKLCRALTGDMTRAELQMMLGFGNREHFRSQFLVPAIRSGYVELTIPDKKHSKNQMYRLTQTGKQLILKTQIKDKGRLKKL